MKFCVIGDPHFANRKVFARPTKVTGVNSRLLATRHTFETIGEDLEEDIEHVLVLGDITHDHGILTPAVYYMANSALWDLACNDRVVRVLSGNHDIDAYGMSIVPVFEYWDDNGEEKIEHVQAGQMISHMPDAEEWVVYGISFMSHARTIDALESMEKHFMDKRVVLCMHHHFDGAEHGVHEFQPAGGLNPSDIPDCVEVVLSGHYHKRQKIGKRILYVGAPMQQDFGESTYTPGYTIVKLLNGKPPKIEFREIPATVAPRFHILPYNLPTADIPGLPESDYYRIDIPYDCNMSEAHTLAKKLKYAAVRVVPVTSVLRSRVEKHLAKEGKEGKLELGDIIEAYAAMNAEPGHVDELVDLGMDIANKVINEE
jgi:DNA repair exonuclease SbcCD nuclease subunit